MKEYEKLRYICVYVLSRSVMSESLWPMDCSPPGSSVRGILPAGILEWVAMPSSSGSSQPGYQTQASHILYHLSHQGKSCLKVYYQAIILQFYLSYCTLSVQSFVVTVLFLRFLEMRKAKIWSHGKVHKLESVRAKVQSLKSKTYSLYHRYLRCTIFPRWE